MSEERKYDKSRWEAGPWEDEPDKLEWRDESTGLPCLIVRGPVGALCGYVAVSPGHPWHGKHYDGCDADVHGGLTYSDKCAGAICHAAKPGEPDDVWWLGFDCAHLGDFIPGIRDRFEATTYKDIAYVRRECATLAGQVAAVRS